MEPTRWAVQGVLPEGVTLLAGKPKQGESWMALGLWEAIAAGGVAFGTRRVEKGETLYLALEGNERRMQKRIRKVLDGRGCPVGMN
jgi:RecA-family ATPase